MKNNCLRCGKELGPLYQFIEYAEKEIIPTAGGGCYARFLARFCEPWCLMNWLQVEKPEPVADPQSF